MSDNTAEAQRVLRVIGNYTEQWALDDMFKALTRAQHTDPNVRAYWSGHALGQAIGWEPGPSDALTVAQQQTYAAAAPYEQIAQSMRLLPIPDGRKERVFRASGVLAGYKEATAHLDDAEECQACDRRILPELNPGEEVRCGNHGWLCGDECRRDLCGKSCYEPEMDKDWYYGWKYGDAS